MPKRKTVDKEYQELTEDVDIVALQANIKAFFTQFPDPRITRRQVYPAWYLILLVLCAFLSGCNTISDIAVFAEIRNTWLNTLLGTEFKTPSYDTIWWFLVRVKPKAFKDLMSKWVQALPSNLKNQLLVVDGKRLRGISDSEHITHLVELFAADTGIVVSQERVADKSCERSALPKLLESIDVQGAIISMDAHYAYQKDLKLVLNAGADYIVGIKGNQGNLEAEVENYFNQVHAIQNQVDEIECHSTLEKGHGRIEVRHVSVAKDLSWLTQKEAWGLESLIEVRSERVIGDKTERGTRYYGCSRKGTAKEFSDRIRSHWSIENGVHYIADVVFKEDASQVDTGNAAENMSLIRRLTMNIVRTLDPKRGLADARRNATFEPNYLRGLLSRLFT